jgi:hypothetical protein
MHCPRCGQQQISDQTKFCSRCGFQLGLVAELLDNGGFLPQLAELHKKKGAIFSRRNGVIFCVLWFIFFVMMMPAFFGIADLDDAAGVSAVFGLFSTIMLLIISLAVLPKTPKIHETSAYQIPPAPYAHGLYGNQQMGALPPQQSEPASTYVAPTGNWRAPDTGDVVRPGSVTESTTRLLKKDEEL